MSALMSALSVGCCRLGSPRRSGNHGTMRVWRLLSPPVVKRGLLAMQKVEGSSPFIRFIKPPETGAFSLHSRATPCRIASVSASVTASKRVRNVT